MEPVLRNKAFTYSFELKHHAVQLYQSGYTRTEMAEMLHVAIKDSISQTPLTSET
jgi:transposase-like protein